jgi:outer membrane protein assembly factor BamB
VLWNTDSGEVGAFSSPAFADGTIYVGNDGHRRSAMHAIDPATGTVKWKFTVPNQIFSTPAVRDGAVYFHVRDDHVYALSAADGSLLWKFPAPSRQNWFDVYQDLTKSSPAVDEARVYVGIEKDLVALDRKTGAVSWRAPTGRKVDSTPLVVGPTVYVGSDDKNLYALDAATGRQVWSFKTGGRVSSSPTYGEGLILVGSNDGYLYAFEGAKTPSPAR